jgi:hypothetical protein
MLEVSVNRLAFHLFRLPGVKRYTTFEIKKKSGGTRMIKAPISALKILQRKLAYVLSVVYKPKSGTHGFVNGRSIVTNARQHAKAKFVLNIDLKDFFPSINFGVRGMLMAIPYTLNSTAATVLAQICCVDKLNRHSYIGFCSVLAQCATRSRVKKLVQIAMEGSRLVHSYFSDVAFGLLAIRDGKRLEEAV